DRPCDGGVREGTGQVAPVPPQQPVHPVSHAKVREGSRTALPSTISLHPPPPGPARPPDEPELRPSPPGGRPQMVLVVAGASAGGDVPGLLRRRLRFFSLLVVTIYALNSLYAGRSAVDTGLALAVNAGLTAMLWSRTPHSWRGLRLAELVGLGSLAVEFGMAQWGRLEAGLTPHPPGGRDMTLLARATAIEWFCLIMVYGLFVPNT